MFLTMKDCLCYLSERIIGHYNFNKHSNITSMKITKMKSQLGRVSALCILTLLCCFSLASAAIKLPAIISDNMVLQRNINVPIWGWANAGENVEVKFQGKIYKTIAGSDGKWALKLGSYKAGGPYEMTIKGNDNQIIIKNILVGEVWVASGQSNMEFGIQTERHGADAIAKAKDTLMHFFYVPMAQSLQQKDDIAGTPDGSPNGKWVVCSPEIMANPKWAWHGITAAGYYFSQQIRQDQGCPVGLIATYKGGTPAQSYISMNSLEQKPAFDNYVSWHKKLVDNYEKANAAYPQEQADYKEALKQWNAEVGDEFAKAMTQWQTEAAQAKANGGIAPPQPKPSKPRPKEPSEPSGGFGAPGNIYNAMIAPIIPYGIKGVIWYQGEGNGDRFDDAIEYRNLFPRLITDWRADWKQGSFPFLFVQLPNYRKPAVNPSEGNWPWVREAQLKTLSLPNTGMAVITDIGETDNIHPTNKLDVGIRLGLVARHVAYNEKVVYSGPVYNSMSISGNTIRLKLNSMGSGLVAGLPSASGQAELKGFGIAGDDGNFVWATAVIDGDTIIVSSDQVANPVAARYNWADNPPGNLYNKEGLPASPFRTDDWKPMPGVRK
jgi:sialate O-acetylesterase